VRWDEMRKEGETEKEDHHHHLLSSCFGYNDGEEKDEKRKKSNFSYLSDFCVYSKQPMEPLNSLSFMSQLPLCLIPRLEETKSPFWRERETGTQRDVRKGEALKLHLQVVSSLSSFRLSLSVVLFSHLIIIILLSLSNFRCSPSHLGVCDRHARDVLHVKVSSCLFSFLTFISLPP